jgi:hypothetical protein
MGRYCPALASRGVRYPHRGAKLGDILVLYLGALGENVYALYRFGHPRHLRYGFPGRSDQLSLEVPTKSSILI